MAGDSHSRPAPYKLSALLQGHTDDVRCVTADRSGRLASASRDGSARLWKHTDASGGSLARCQACEWTEGHEGFVNSVAFVPPIEGAGEGYIATAGADSLIQLYDLSSPTCATQPTYTLLGHAHNVCALDISADGRQIASASWDMTARVWTWVGGEEGWSCTSVLVDHKAAVWDVLLIRKKPDILLTACADSRIRLFDLKSGDTTLTFKAHTGPVRALAKLLPEDLDCALFASASNDGDIIIWNYETGESLTNLGSHDSFIYSLAALPGGGGLASSGEEGLIKIWNEEDGEMDQELVVPALSVWSLAALPNGDIACGCSDNLIWIFSRNSERAADEATVMEYDRLIAARKASKAQRKEEPVVHDAVALHQAGTEDEVKLVRRGSKTWAYQWSKGRWDEVGEVYQAEASEGDLGTGQNRAKMQHEGVEYDFVFHIDVRDDMPPIPLAYNQGDNVEELASTFVKTHALPESYVDRIVDFVRAATALQLA
ncbi:hypothetical protein JCM10908_001187 [Rhodotorula pacifica]|uniref:uncharacterized protein n=1 Tax=Rhodotorula pacifica TaxID=1495444 RepID=UPI00316F0608